MVLLSEMRIFRYIVITRKDTRAYRAGIYLRNGFLLGYCQRDRQTGCVCDDFGSIYHRHIYCFQVLENLGFCKLQSRMPTVGWIAIL